jgi:hypothetical protein
MRTRLGVMCIGLSSLRSRFALSCLSEWKSSPMGVALGSCHARCVCVYFLFALACFWVESGGTLFVVTMVLVVQLEGSPMVAAQNDKFDGKS